MHVLDNIQLKVSGAAGLAVAGIPHASLHAQQTYPTKSPLQPAWSAADQPDMYKCVLTGVRVVVPAHDGGGGPEGPDTRVEADHSRGERAAWEGMRAGG